MARRTREASPVEPAPFLRRLDTVLARFLRGLLPEERRYWVLVPVTGILAGLAAVALEELLVLVQKAAWGTSEQKSITQAVTSTAKASPWIAVAILTCGGAIVAALLYLIGKRKDELHGTPALIEALAFKKGRVPFLRTLVESLAAMTAVGTGASLGREGAMIHSGAALGSFLGVKLRLEDHHVRILLACGAAAGIAAAYRVPIGASIFAMEVLLGSFALDLFGPIVICSVISTAIAQVAMGDLPVYDELRDKLKLVTEWEILLDLVLGALLGLVSVVFIRVFSGLGRIFRWLEPLGRLRPVLAMMLLAALGLTFPHLFGNGYDTVNHVLKGEYDAVNHVLRHAWKDGSELSLSLRLLIGLPVLKIVATALCRAGGIPGGLFTPSLFVGALAGFVFGAGVNGLFPPDSVAKPGAYALVGMGAILAGTIQAPVTAILMIFEMTQDYAIILPLMSACIASALVSRLFQAGSLYTEPLRRRGIRLPEVSAPAWLRQPTVRTFVNPVVATVSPAERFEQVVDTFLTAPEGQDHIYVTSREGEYLGAISLHEIKRYFRETAHLESVIAADILNPSAPWVHADEPLSRVLEILAESEAERLPVLDGPGSRKLLGTVSKRALLAAYAEASLAKQQGGR